MLCSFPFFRFAALAAGLATPAAAQPCAHTLNAQADVDQYACSTAPQGLWIESTSLTDPITNLQGLSGLTHVGGWLYIAHNDQLQSLNGLESLRTVDGMLSISYNDSLTDVGALRGITSLNYGPSPHSLGFGLAYNLQLTDCYCGVAPLLKPSVTNGSRIVAGNGPGCASRAAILASATPQGCVVVADPHPGDKTPAGFLTASPMALPSAAPNPAVMSTVLRFDTAQPAQAQLSVYDVLGREVAASVDRGGVEGLFEAVLDVSALPAGAYVARLVAEDEVQTVSFTVSR